VKKCIAQGKMSYCPLAAILYENDTIVAHCIHAKTSYDSDVDDADFVFEYILLHVRQPIQQP
jgi:hypothetical protein